jgi:hypothetical protein
MGSGQSGRNIPVHGVDLKVSYPRRSVTLICLTGYQTVVLLAAEP